MPKSKKDKSPSFEQALEELETMVESMESGQLPLEELVSNYERGAKLVTHCESVLDDARQRLELLTLKPAATNSDGKHSQHSATSKNQEAAKPNNDNFNNDDEIRLF